MNNNKKQTHFSPSTQLVVSQLKKFPRNEWHWRIAKLTKEQKKELMEFLNANKSNGEDNHNGNFLHTLNIPNDRGNITPNENLSNTHVEKNEGNNESTKMINENRDRKSPLEDNNISRKLEIAIELVVNNRKIKHIIKRALFVAGDCKEPPEETVFLIHSYLNVWVYLLYCKYSTNHTFSNTKKRKKNNIQEFLSQEFPNEISRYEMNEKIIKKARLYARSSNTPSETLLTFDTKSRVENKSSLNPSENNVSSHSDLICHPSRFDERLKLQDLRTNTMSTHEYQMFTQARSKSFNSNKKIISEWISELVSTPSTTTSSNDTYTLSSSKILSLSSSFSSFVHIWIFIINDRLASIVELAEKLNFSDIDISDTSIKNIQNLLTSPQLIELFTHKSNEGPFSISKPININSYKSALKIFFESIDSEITEFQIDWIFKKVCYSTQIKDDLIKNSSQEAVHSSSSSSSDSSDYDDEHEDERLHLTTENSSEMLGSIYDMVGLELSQPEIDTLGSEGLWSEIVKSLESHISPEKMTQAPQIDEYMLFLSMRLKELLWQRKEEPDSQKIFSVLNEEWKILNSTENKPEEINCNISLSELQNSILQLKKYLAIAQKISNIFQFFNNNFPELLPRVNNS